MAGFDEFGATSNSIDWGDARTSPGYYDLLKQNQEQPMDMGGSVPGATTPTPAVETNVAPVGGDILAQPKTPSFLDRLSGAFGKEGSATKVLQSGPWLDVASALSGGQNTIQGQLIGIGSAAAKANTMNEARRKLIASQLGGGTGFQDNPASESIGLSGLDVLGMTPEQVTGLYDTALKVREGERKYPLEVMKSVGDLYQSVTTGNYNQAQIPHLQAQIDKLTAEAKYLPEKQRMEVLKQAADINKTLAETKNIPLAGEKMKAETINLGFEPNLMAAKTMETWASKSLKDAESNYKIWQMNPERHKEDMEKARAMPYEIHANPKGYTIFSKITGGKQDVAVDATTPPSVVNELGLMMATSTMMPLVEKDFVANLPPGTKDAREQWANFLATMSKESTPDAKDRLIRGQLSPANMNKYNQILDLYRVGVQNGVPTAALDNMARANILSAPIPKPAPVSAKPSEAFTAPITKPQRSVLGTADTNDYVKQLGLKVGTPLRLTVNKVDDKGNRTPMTLEWDGKGKLYATP